VHTQKRVKNCMVNMDASESVNRRSLSQNAMFQALINQVAQQAQHQGFRWDSEDWRRFLVDQWAAETGRKTGRVAPSLDGERVVQLGMQTRKFTKADASEFTEWLLAWGQHNGITYSES